MLKITPTKMLDILTPLYAKTINVPTVMLWGQPGVGKSEGVRRLADRLAQQTGKEVRVEDIRLLLYNPVDLRGIPVPDAERAAAKWLRPFIFQLDPNPEIIHILLLDELTAALPSVQAAAYQLILDRKIGEHKLPDNVIIIAAGNRLQDKGVAYKMPTPLANRMSHFEVISDFEDWKEWAITKGIHEMVIGFLNFRSEYLNKFDPNTDSVAFPTPRTWAFVSNYLKIYEDIEKAYPMIVSTIGEGFAVEFKSFTKTYDSLPNIHDIIDGVPVRLENMKPDVICALSSLIVSRASSFSKDELRNAFHFLLDSGLQSEFQIMTMKDLLKIDEVSRLLRQFQRFPEWYVKNKKYL
jgi:hypothetical protein